MWPQTRGGGGYGAMPNPGPQRYGAPPPQNAVSSSILSSCFYCDYEPLRHNYHLIYKLLVYGLKILLSEFTINSLK